ncbi:hypothetical protein AHMF7605_22695 [Adhaeribacter arboris]|uniref:RHS repeat-associated core domain-containing protein n=2 Tax=Adhaeribacter arboris TaxID=2072846 RepID=A0A2T2YPI0_9BACT|nr:hypothetical protein AHMF7605_22695 [Adhaeribacter arboris]
MILKKVPGAQPIRMVYNRRDQLILTQDGEQSKTNQWSFTKYDAFSRPILSGMLTDNRTHDQMQAAAAEDLTPFETQNSTASSGYTLTNSFPTNVTDADLLTITYYDGYNYPALQNTTFAFTAPGSPANGWASDYFERVKEQVTGQRVKVLGSFTWLTTANYYDDNYRLIQTVADNSVGGIDRLASRYDFTGKVLETLATHTKGNQSHIVTTSFTYDHGGRLLQTTQQMDGANPVVLATNQYNELGQLIDKKLHRSVSDNNYLQSVDYRYTIRGWLTHINNTALSNDNGTTNDDTNDVFGFELTYNQPTSDPKAKAQFNGNIAESFWKTSTDKQLRGYHYAYDPVNRLTGAAYLAPSASTEDYSVSNISYDANGNIRTMNRKGLRAEVDGVKTFGDLDKLKYSYSAASGNQLLGVDDTETTATPHDFEDLNARKYHEAAPEYAYDANGNLIKDDNKGITHITYNHLNLPQRIYFGSDKYLDFSYNAAGIKLRKRVVESGKADKVTDYSGSFVYQNDTLQFAHSSEGRVLYKPATNTWQYEYHLKDHLGNLRVSFAEPTVEQHLATMEVERAEQETKFKDFGNTKVPVATALDHTHTTTYSTGATPEVVRLNRGRSVADIRPSLSLRVMPGDHVQAKVYAKYLDLRQSQLNANVLLAALTGAAGYSITSDGVLTTVVDNASGTAATLQNGGSSDQQPHAYLNYYLFDENNHRITSGYEQVNSTAAMYDAASTNGNHQELVLNIPPIEKAGYLRIELSHDVAENIDIYFDDLTITHQHGLIVQENHYDPWGLNLTGIESKGQPDHKFQYNGKERQEEFGLNWSDYGARFYDPQLGQWHSVDPLADKMRRHSPYNYAFDNPIRFIDLDGMAPQNPEGDDPNLKYGKKAKASDVAPSSEKVLKEIAKDAGLEELTITNTARTPAHQARVMYENKVKGKSSSYGRPGKEVLKVYDKMAGKNSPKEIKSAMTDKINELGPTTVSHHASDPSTLTVVDVSIASVKSQGGFNAQRNFVNTVESYVEKGAVSKFLHPGNNKGEAAYHIEIKVTAEPQRGIPMPKMDYSQLITW